MRLRPVCKAIQLCFWLGVAAPAWPGPDEDRIAQEAATKAAEAYARDRVADYINREAASGLTSGTGTGTAIFATIDLGTSVYDFSKAENDKQRAYAGSRAAIAGYALLGGPAAPVLAAVLLAASLIESGLAAQHQAEMLKIYEEIARHYARVVEINKMMIEADWLQYRQLLATAVGSLAEYKANSYWYSQKCDKTSKLVTLGDLDECVAKLGRSVVAAELFVESVQALDQWRVGKEQLFESLEGQVGIDAKAIIEAKAAAKKMLREVKPTFDGIVVDFAKLATEITVSKALDSAQFPTSEWVHMNCIEAVMEHARQGTSLLLQSQVLGHRIGRVKVNAYLEGTRLYQASVCTGRASDLYSPYSSLLKDWNQTLAKTRSEVTKRVRKG